MTTSTSTHTEHAHDPPPSPAKATAAHIPLQTFSLPDFPPSTDQIQALTLTSDIPLTSYAAALTEEYSIPPLPPAIESLTLEGFSFGFPKNWLATIGQRCKKTRSLVIYSQVLGGEGKEGRDDLKALFEQLDGLRALHLLECFSRAGVVEAFAPFVKADSSSRKGLMFLEVSYECRLEDPEFLSRIPAKELPLLVGPGLISLAFNINASQGDAGADDEDEKVKELDTDGTELPDSVAKDGIISFGKTYSSDLVKALTADASRPKSLRLLNTTLYTVTWTDVKQILDVHSGLMVLIVTIEAAEVEGLRPKVMDILREGRKLEQIEIVLDPALDVFFALQNVRSKALTKALPNSTDLQALSDGGSSLKSFKASILRSSKIGTVEFRREDGKWEGGLVRETSSADDTA